MADSEIRERIAEVQMPKYERSGIVDGRQALLQVPSTHFRRDSTLSRGSI